MRKGEEERVSEMKIRNVVAVYKCSSHISIKNHKINKPLLKPNKFAKCTFIQNNPFSPKGLDLANNNNPLSISGPK